MRKLPTGFQVQATGKNRPVAPEADVRVKGADYQFRTFTSLQKNSNNGQAWHRQATSNSRLP
jgi:hypothetical protein